MWNKMVSWTVATWVSAIACKMSHDLSSGNPPRTIFFYQQLRMYGSSKLYCKYQTMHQSRSSAALTVHLTYINSKAGSGRE